jgi:hypothetical protein
MLIVIAALAIVAVLAYIFFSKKTPPTIPVKPVEVEEPVAEEIKEVPKQGVGFKQLKNMAKKKGGKSVNPTHESYVSALKGMQSAVVDFDFYRFQDGATLVVVGEEQSVVRAYLIKDFAKESEFVSAQGSLKPGSNVISVSVGPLRVTDSKNFSMQVAVAIFDHCSVEFFDLSCTQGGKLVFTALSNKLMTNIHKMPVRQIRLSKKHPSIMVSCGDESDLYVKLWNLSLSKTEPVNQI